LGHPHRRAPWCPLPEPRGSFGRTAPPARSRSVFVVSHYLDDLLHPGVAGLLHPAAGRMFAAFRGSTPRRSLHGTPFRSSRRCSHPPKMSSSTAAPRHRGPCLLVVRLRPLGLAPFLVTLLPSTQFSVAASVADLSPPGEGLVGAGRLAPTRPGSHPLSDAWPVVGRLGRFPVFTGGPARLRSAADPNSQPRARGGLPRGGSSARLCSGRRSDP
jgi:hypothetical protein